MANPAIRIHPNLSVRYYEFYLRGLRSLYGGRSKITPDPAGMPPIRDPKSGMAVLTPDGVRIYVAANDMSAVDEDALDWCHVYGKVNLAYEDLGRDPRLIAIGPGFGIPCRSRRDLVRLTLTTSLRSQPRHAPARLRDYWRFQASRAPISRYVPSPSDPDYLFMIATFWVEHPEVNRRRLGLLERLSTVPGLRVEGGFWSDRVNPDEYADFALERSVSHEKYLALTGRSVAVLNTAAVHDCLGWKLGEYFALGKAIVSPPLTRAMPSEVTHERHIHFTDGTVDAALAAIERIRSDAAYRRILESNARDYWARYLAPEAVVRRMLAHARSL